jgi:hypothetical protein
MPTLATIPRSAATPARAHDSGPAGKVFTYRSREYLASAPGTGEPQAFLVEMPEPGSVIPPHFHREDEFQVVVAGRGSLGKHALEGVAVHFADAYTPYGPIRVGPEGLTFFTLRAKADPGAEYMPESRERMARKARRSVAADVPALGPTGALWPTHDDGLGAWIVRAGPGENVPSPAGDGGRYYLILEGSVAHGATALPRWSCIWKADGAPHPALIAGPEGADVAVVQFPLEKTR